MSRISDRQQKIIEEFHSLKTWEDRYKSIIARGKKLNPMPETLKTEDRKVKGCQSQVWLEAQLSPLGEVYFQADSDALIVKGLIALLLEVYDGTSPREILEASPDFLKVLGFEQNLSPSRTNGLFSMLKQIQHYAMAFDYLLKTRST